VGTASRTNRILIVQEIRFNSNVMPGCPRPCRILLKVELRYRNGQSQPRVAMNVPARAFLNRKLPRKFPVIRKPAVEIKPSRRQDSIVFFMV
jgi:hypothetical protein